MFKTLTFSAAAATLLASSALADSNTATKPLFDTTPELHFSASQNAPAPTVSSQGFTGLGGTADWTGLYAGAEVGVGIVDTNISGDSSDIIGGLTLGYDYDFGQWVVGGGFDYDFANINAGPGIDFEEVFRAKARAGYKISQGLLYATGGYASAKTDTAGRDDGWFIGGGYEYLVSDQFSIGTEVLYHQFDNFNHSGRDIDATTVQLRGTFRF